MKRLPRCQVALRRSLWLACWIVLIIGLVGLCLFGWLGFDLFGGGRKPYTKDDLELVRGRIDRAGVITSAKGANVLELWLQNQPLPFHAAASPTRSVIEKIWLPALQAGVAIEIGILPAEKANPHRSGIHRQKFLNIYSLTVNGERALSVEDYNRCAQDNDDVGRIVDPILLAVSLLLVVASLQAIRRQRHS